MVINQTLLINNQLADMPPDGTGIPLYKVILDYNNPTERGGDFTYNVDLPITEANTRIFGAIDDPAALGKFIRQDILRTRYNVGGIDVFEGTCELRSITPTAFQVQFYGFNIEWIDHFNNNKLQTLQLPDIGFIGHTSQDPTEEPLDALTQEDIWTLPPTATDLTFGLVAYGNYPRNSPLKGERAWRIQDVIWQDIPPSVFCRSIVLQCFKEAGLEVRGTWIESLELSGLNMPYTGEEDIPWNWGFLSRTKYERTSNFTFESATLGAGGNNQDFQSIPFYLDGWIVRVPDRVHDYCDAYFTASPDNEYIVPIGGGYTFSLELSVSSMLKDTSFPTAFIFPEHQRIAVAIVRIPDTPDELDALKQDIGLYLSDPLVTAVVSPEIIAFYDFGTNYADSPAGNVVPSTTGTTYTQTWNGIPYGTLGSQITGSGIVKVTSPECQLSRADKVQAWLVNTTTNNYLGSFNLTSNNAVLRGRCSSLPDRLAPATVLPDWTRYEFFSGLLRMFNLYYEVDIKGKSIRIESRNNFFASTASAIDYTDRCRISDAFVSPMPYAKVTDFKYAEDSNDAMLSRHLPTFANISITVDANAHDKDQDTISLPWAPTYDRIYQAAGAGATFSLLSIPCMASAEIIETPQADVTWVYNYTPRILRYIGLQPGSWRYHGTPKTSYPAQRFSYDEVNQFSLMWANSEGLINQRGSIIRGSYPSKGIYSRHWLILLNDRQFGHIAKMPVQFNALAFSQLQVSRPILIQGMVWYLYQLDGGFDPSVDTTLDVSFMRY